MGAQFEGFFEQFCKRARDSIRIFTAGDLQNDGELVATRSRHGVEAAVRGAPKVDAVASDKGPISGQDERFQLPVLLS